MPRSYAIGEFAEELGFHPETVKRWCRSGNLGYARTPGGDRRIPHRELLRLADDLITLVANFSGKLYEMRSNKKQQVVKAVEVEVNADD